MSEHFFLLLDQGESEEQEPIVRWYREGGSGTAPSQGSLEQAAEAARDAHVVVVLPGQHCLALPVQLPNASRSRLAQAVPFALEEQLVEDVDDLHFALGESQDGTVPVVVVKHALMERWLAQLEQSSLSPKSMVPDYLALSLPQQGWHLWFGEQGIVLRNGIDGGMQIALNDPLLLLQRLYDEVAQKPEQLLVSGQPGDMAASLVEWCSQHEMALVEGDSEADLLSVAANSLEGDRCINLLQGRYSQQEKMSRQWRPWFPAVAILATIALFQLISTGLDYQRLSTQSAELDEQIKQLYLDTFPDARKVVNPRAQMEARLKAQGKSGGGELFYILMGGVTTLADNKVNFELQRIRYQGGELNVDLYLDDLQVLDQIKQVLAQKSDIQTEVVSASARGSKVEARLLIKGGES